MRDMNQPPNQTETGDLIELWQDDFHWKLGYPLAIISVKPKNNGNFLSECFLLNVRPGERTFDQQLRKLHFLKSANDDIDMQLSLDRAAVSEHSLGWVNTHLRIRVEAIARAENNFSYLRQPKLVKAKEWKRSLKTLRYADQLPNEFLNTISGHAQCESLSKIADYLLGIEPFRIQQQTEYVESK
jgi:hypothetical protein